MEKPSRYKKAMRSDYLTKKRQKELTWLALFIYGASAPFA
jgi:hypothetical protein